MENESLEEKKKIEDRMTQIYEEVSANIWKQDNESTLQDIIFYNELTLIKPGENIGIAEQNVYVARIKDPKQRILMNAYNENMQISTVDENGKIEFTEEYLSQLKEIDERFYKVAKTASNKEKLELPEELDKEDAVYTKEELEQKKKSNRKREK